MTISRNSYLRVYKVSAESRNLDDMSTRDLFALACEKIRYQQEFLSLKPEIQNKCKGLGGAGLDSKMNVAMCVSSSTDGRLAQ